MVKPKTKLEVLHEEIDRCYRCRDSGYDIRKPPHIDRGPLVAKVMMIGIAPGQSATAKGKAFAGNSFSRLHSWIQQAGFDYTESMIRERCYLTSLNKCAAEPDTLANRKGLWGHCHRFLYEQLDLVRPPLVILLGKEPRDLIIPAIKNRPLAEDVGLSIPAEEAFHGQLFPPTAIRSKWLIGPHPSGLSRIMNSEPLRDRFINKLNNELRNINF